MPHEEIPCEKCITFARCREKLKSNGGLYNSLIRFGYEKCPLLIEYIQIGQYEFGTFNYERMDRIIRLARGYDLCK